MRQPNYQIHASQERSCIVYACIRPIGLSADGHDAKGAFIGFGDTLAHILHC